MPARELKGTVVSNRGDKTAVVLVERRVLHPVQKKFIRRSKKYHVHDEQNACQIGDTVRIREVPPISKLKTWLLVERQEATGRQASNNTQQTQSGGEQ